MGNDIGLGLWRHGGMARAAYEHAPGYAHERKQGATHHPPPERAMLIADSCNEVLALKRGSLLVNPDLL